jgi:defect-in-organelle-trafficking protein DotD
MNCHQNGEQAIDMKRKTLPTVLLAALVAGCAMGPYMCPQKEEAPAQQQDQALSMLNRTARSIEQSLTHLAEAEQYEKMKVKPNEPRIYKQVPGMEAMVTMPWRGTLEQAVSKLAGFSGYVVKFMGKPPVIPILVQIGSDPATISDHIRNIGIQAGNRADIIVDPKQRIVEVRYGNGL